MNSLEKSDFRAYEEVCCLYFPLYHVSATTPTLATSPIPRVPMAGTDVMGPRAAGHTAVPAPRCPKTEVLSPFPLHSPSLPCLGLPCLLEQK